MDERDRGERFFNQGAYVEELAHYSRALELCPNKALFNNGKGMCLYNMNEFERAIECFAHAYKLDLQNRITSSTKQWHFYLDRDGEALQVIVGGLKRNPADIDLLDFIEFLAEIGDGRAKRFAHDIIRLANLPAHEIEDELTEAIANDAELRQFINALEVMGWNQPRD